MNPGRSLLAGSDGLDGDLDVVFDLSFERLMPVREVERLDPGRPGNRPAGRHMEL
jgi:hypothetical protein